MEAFGRRGCTAVGRSSWQREIAQDHDLAVRQVAAIDDEAPGNGRASRSKSPLWTHDDIYGGL